MTRLRVVVGLDVGTTATKAVAFALDSAWTAVIVREYPLLVPRPGRAEQDIAVVRAAARDALAGVVAAVDLVHDDWEPVCVSVSAALHGLVALDADGEPLTPLLTWADGRSVDEARALRAWGLAEDVHRTTGTPVHPMTPLTKILWFGRHEPELVSRVRCWAGLKDVVLRDLTGQLVTEASSASATALLDLRTRTWSSAMTGLAGITPDVLPPVLPTTAVLPLSVEAARASGLPAGTPVVVGAGDGPLGNVGTGALSPGVVGLSLGTSGAVRMVVDEPVLDPAGRLFCYALTEDRWVVGGASSTGGVVVRWAGAVLGAASGASGPELDAELLALAEDVPPGSDGLVMLPYLLPERAPLWDPELAGAYLGLRMHHTRGHLVRAAVEGVALQLGLMVDALDRLRPVSSVRATGGTFRSVLWRQVVAAAVGRPLVVTGGADGSALGAAALGLLAVGAAPDLESALALLAPRPATPEADDVPEVASTADVARYRALRASVPGLLSAYDDVARLFAEAGGGQP